MLYAALFEVDLNNAKIAFVQDGILDGVLQPYTLYDHDSSLRDYIDTIVHPDEREAIFNTFCYSSYLDAADRGDSSINAEYRALIAETGQYEWVFMNATFTKGATKKAVGSIENIHQIKVAELFAEYNSSHDALTGLLNKSAFEASISEQLIDKELKGSYFCLDLDDFRNVNDCQGHSYGDTILSEICACIKSVLPANALFARLGGDEFAIYLPNLIDSKQVSDLAQTILMAVKSNSNNLINITASIGISFFPEHGTSFIDGFSERANIALRKAKINGKNIFLIYNPSMGMELAHLSVSHNVEIKKEKSKLSSFLYSFNHNAPAFFAIIASLILASCIFAAASNSYISKLKCMVDAESYSYLDEISTQISQNLVKLLKFNFNTLESLKNNIELKDYTWTFDSINKVLEKEKEIYGFDELSLIDKNGIWHVNGSKYRHPDLANYVEKVDIQDVPFLTNMVNIGKYANCSIFFYPIDNIKIGSTTIVAIAAIASIEKLNEMLPLSLFDNKGFAHVVSTDGSVVIRSNNAASNLKNFNVISTLKYNSTLTDDEIDSIVKDMHNGESRRIRFSIWGNDLVATYSPIGFMDWYLFTIVPASVLTQSTDGFYQLTLFATAILSIIFMCLIVLAVIIQIKSKNALARLAFVDNITNGCSKIKFDKDVSQLLRQQRHKYSMIYANIERFKLINQNLGKRMADKLLCYIYSVFEKDLEPNERVARIMADHFAIMICTQDLNILRKRLEDWNREIGYYVSSSDELFSVTLSYGIYQIDDPLLDVPLILDRANLARKTLRPANRHELHYALYDDKLKRQMLLEKELEDRQEQALQNDEFLMFLQPKYNPFNGNIVGAEALVRWITSDKGLIFPDSFIPIFETNGFITKIDLYIFGKVCDFLLRMKIAGLAPINISINLSRVHLNNEHFFKEYLEIWNKYNLDASFVEFEITETLIFENSDRLNEIISIIHSHGFKVSMDDFGSGYSSLNMLKSINIDALKLDKQFFSKSADSSEKGRLIVRHIIDLAKDLNMEVIAEGVEDESQVAYLKEYGCSIIQGYYYARPQPADHVFAMLLQFSPSFRTL